MREEPLHLLFVLDARRFIGPSLVNNRVLLPKLPNQIVFRPFALVTFIWASK
jgi:hypothetical protein